LVLPVRLKQDAIDDVDVDRPTHGSAERFEHRRQAEIASLPALSINRTNDQARTVARDRYREPRGFVNDLVSVR
jgi:hypothetical protein